ncbi:uncharacterized protein LOC123525908 [Mercenaria mercenaria]|uniref:uncharacterized protein LOC123525908 n=1 Tax=Mercenaria mercenaria TaxID=6596 RepID=UPI00234F5B5D|nr:uncharacterized protein LOC123525908 [Mercenaria mercenaria]
MPSFTGKEDWATWKARFEAVARRYRRGREERLDQLLPGIEGQASECVFTHLPPSNLQNYGDLITELNNRHRKIETTRFFATKFSARTQRQGEIAEEYVADLKRLYDKAHGYRDRRTRDEDLVRRFLDGLKDEEIRFEIEYHKKPANIDEAVFHVVNLIQTRSYGRTDRRNKQGVRRFRAEDTDDRLYHDSPRYERAKRVPEWKNAEKKKKEETNDQMKVLDQILERLSKLEKAHEPQPHKQTDQNKRADIKNMECFHCRKNGHFARNYPLKKTEDRRTDARDNGLGTVEEIFGREGETIDGVYIEGTVEGKPVVFTADTSASRNILSSRVYHKLGDAERPPLKSSARLKGAEGTPIKILGKAVFGMKLGELHLNREIIVADIEDDALLGYDILNAADLLLSKNMIMLEGKEKPCRRRVSHLKTRKVIVAGDVEITGRTETLVDVFIERSETDGSNMQADYLVEPTEGFKEKYQLELASTLVDITDIKLRQDAVIGKAEKVQKIVSIVSEKEHESEVDNLNRIRRVDVVEKKQVESMPELPRSKEENSICPFEVASRQMSSVADGGSVSKDGVRPDPTNTSKILQWSRPETPKQVKQFVATGSYYRKFVRGFATTARPLIELTKKGKEFIWSIYCEKVFCALKEALTSPDVMGYPLNDGGMFILDADALGIGIGSVLAQEQGGRERVIAYASRGLNKAEQNYCITAQELLAVVFFIQYYRQYLLRRRFLVRTDHQALVWLFSLKEPSGKIARWIEI